MMRWLRPKSDRPRILPMGLEQSAASALILLVAYVVTAIIIDDGQGRGLAWDGSDWPFWTGLQVLLWAGPFWLIGGIGAVVFWPILSMSLVIRSARFVISLNRKTKPE